MIKIFRYRFFSSNPKLFGHVECSFDILVESLRVMPMNKSKFRVFPKKMPENVPLDNHKIVPTTLPNYFQQKKLKSPFKVEERKHIFSEKKIFSSESPLGTEDSVLATMPKIFGRRSNFFAPA